MRRFLIVILAAIGLSTVAIPQAFAGSPHFVDDSVQATNNNNATLTVSGKEAGLGDEQQVHIVITATALCINGGGNHPKAVNKTSVGGAGDFPVQNGKANFSLVLGPAVFNPPCSPPMTVGWTNIVVTDTTNNVTTRLSGTF